MGYEHTQNRQIIRIDEKMVPIGQRI